MFQSWCDIFKKMYRTIFIQMCLQRQYVYIPNEFSGLVLPSIVKHLILSIGKQSSLVCPGTTNDEWN